MNRLFATASVTVLAPAAEVFAVVSDPVLMAALAEETTDARWLDGATRAALGARFKGRNRNGWRRWTTLCTVVALDAGRRFAYHVDVPVFGVPISRWQYEVEPVDEQSCTVTETNWARIPLWFIPFAILITGVPNRPGRNAANIETTLNRLRIYVETGPSLEGSR